MAKRKSLWFFFFRDVLKSEAKKLEIHPANFGPKKYFMRECICEVEGQVPCPGTTPLPKEMRGKYRTQMAAVAAED